MQHFYSRFFLLFLLLLSFGARAQQQPGPAVSGTFTRLPFGQFARQLEAQTRHHFYFDPAAVDSLFITVQAQGQPLRAVLTQALQGTNFHFAIDDENRVFITAGTALEPALPSDFFQPAKAGTVAARATEPVPTTTTGRSPATLTTSAAARIR